MNRLGKILKKADELNMVVILELFFDKIYEDDHFDFNKEKKNFAVALKNYLSKGNCDFRNKDKTDFKEVYRSIPAGWGINSERKTPFLNKVCEVIGGLLVKNKNKKNLNN